MRLLDDVGLPYQLLVASGLKLVVVDLILKYLGPAHFDDRLTLLPAVGEVRNRAARFVYRVERFDDGALLLTTQSGHTAINGEGRLARMSNDIYARLSAA